MFNLWAPYLLHGKARVGPHIVSTACSVGIAILLPFSCPELENRRAELYEAHCPKKRNVFSPHVSLSYDGKGFNVAGRNVLKLVPELQILEIVEEYMEPYDENWS